MKAEVKLIKAYLHFYLIKYYGPICPMRVNIAVDESTQGARVYREKVVIASLTFWNYYRR